MMLPRTPVLFAALALGLLTACGGSGPVQVPFVNEFEGDADQQPNDIDGPGSDGVVDEVEMQDPIDAFGTETPEEVETEGSVLEETLAASDEAEIILTGVALVTNPDGSRAIVRRTGRYDDTDQSRSLADMDLDLTDDIPGAFVVTSSFRQADGVGVVGVATDADMMPTTGDATFTGGAVGFVIVGDAGVDLSNGTSTVTVDFADGRVDVRLSGFTPVSQVSGKLVDAPFDALILDDAEITGNTFTGGRLRSTGETSVGEITGANADLLSEGQFFGQDGDTPAEVGGLIYSKGDGGQIYGSFIAE